MVDRNSTNVSNPNSIALPCKKCGYSRSRKLFYYDRSVRLSCPHCGYCTNLKPTVEEATAAWNERR